ncbi:hypothetical protein UFOVP1040_19 [uncultured Caudovirales phage]|uniref:Uncharacterized protein n=1 Tax=uncultured Caudovirales phage TaxID=2100421 RepID=A0A6J5Q6R8_9CAUD|nr:hypothetical protein UFOVP1040_19 [uncultured Caudovirales phage]
MMNADHAAKCRNATLVSILDVPGAVGMTQTIEGSPDGNQRSVTTRWFDEKNETLRQDQTILVDAIPEFGVVGAANL